jgi:radical SAM protein with 4Fe4S-binding SPASM domain
MKNATDLIKDLIWYRDKHITILKRGSIFLVINPDNVRWYTTNQLGTEILINSSKGIQNCHLRPSSYSLKEAKYLNSLASIQFFDCPEDMPVDIPTVVNISLTERCNLECDYCFYSASYGNSPSPQTENLPYDKMNIFLEELKKLNPNVRVYLTGGEPFMHKDIFRFCKFIKANDLFVGIVTNGTLFNRDNLLHLIDSGIDEIRVSLDGISEEIHNAHRPKSFHKVMKALEDLENIAAPVVISMTVTSNNEHHIMEMADFVVKRGFRLNFSPAVPAGRAARKKQLLPNYEEIVRQIVNVEEKYDLGFLNIEDSQGFRRFTCGLGGNSLYVNLKGDVAPCNKFAKTEHLKANVFKEGLFEILRSENTKEIQLSVDEIELCSDCPIRYVCGGPCRASSYFFSGRLDGYSPDCRYRFSETIASMFYSACYLPAAEQN